MQVRILGPFQVEETGRRITIGGVRQRAVLADLALHANEVVPSEQLLVDLWGEDSPPSAANALQAAISRLRRVLPPNRLLTTAPGYSLRIFPAELDVRQFEQLLAEGRDALAAGNAADAAGILDQALSLWRGPPLADFRYEPFAQAEIARMEELQLACREERAEAHLASARPAKSPPSWAGWSASIPCASVFAASSCSPSTAAAGRPRHLIPTANSEAPSRKNWGWNPRRRSASSKRRSCTTTHFSHPGRPRAGFRWLAGR